MPAAPSVPSGAPAPYYESGGVDDLLRGLPGDTAARRGGLIVTDLPYGIGPAGGEWTGPRGPRALHFAEHGSLDRGDGAR